MAALLGCVSLGRLLREVSCCTWSVTVGDNPLLCCFSRLCLRGLSHPALILLECCNRWDRKAFCPQLWSLRGSQAMIPKVSVFCSITTMWLHFPRRRDTTQEITQEQSPDGSVALCAGPSSPYRTLLCMLSLTLTTYHFSLHSKASLRN